MQDEPNYPEIIARLRSLLKSREEKLRKKRNGYNIAKLKQTVTALEYWEAEYEKTGREAAQNERKTSKGKSNAPAAGTDRIR